MGPTLFPQYEVHVYLKWHHVYTIPIHLLRRNDKRATEEALVRVAEWEQKTDAVGSTEWELTLLEEKYIDDTPVPASISNRFIARRTRDGAIRGL